jgi:hypothetical protein
MIDGLGLNRPKIRVDSHILRSVQNTPLQGILAFLNLSIDDVIDNPIARIQVQHYWETHTLIRRRSERMEALRRKERMARGEPIISD